MSDQNLTIALTVGGVFLLLALSALFSAAETSLTATSRARMHKLEADGDKRAKVVNTLIRDREKLLGAILISNNFLNNLSAVLTGLLFASMFGQGSVGFATLTITVLMVVFSEVAPKTLAISRPDAVALFVAPLMRWIVFVMTPLNVVMTGFVARFLKLFGFDVDDRVSLYTAAEEIRGAVDLHHEEGGLDKDVRDLFRVALDLDDIRVEEIMVHRKSIEMLDLEANPDDIIPLALKSAYTRIPLYRGSTDNIVGVLHAKDLLRALWDADTDPRKIDFVGIARAPYFIPETTTLQEQLDAFKGKQEHFALVVDEYGSIKGLVTLEDILEEIVGEIEDEHDNPVQGVRPQADGSVNIDGDVTIRDLNRALDWNLPDAEAVTIAGLVIHEAQSIPDIGQTFSFHGYRFKILRRRRNQITAVKLTPLAAAKAAQ